MPKVCKTLYITHLIFSHLYDTYIRQVTSLASSPDHKTDRTADTPLLGAKSYKFSWNPPNKSYLTANHKHGEKIDSKCFTGLYTKYIIGLEYFRR